MTQKNIGKGEEFYEEFTLAEKDSNCPHFEAPCVKDPQKCRFYQPFLVTEVTALQTLKNREIYMCLYDILRISLNNALLVLNGQLAMNAMGPMGGRPGMPPGGPKI